MDSKPLRRLFFNIVWTFVFFLQHVNAQSAQAMLSLDSRVFVAFKGQDLTLGCHVHKPANQSADALSCFDPAHNLIYSCPIASTAGGPQSFNIQLMLKHLNASGEYHCKYLTAAVYWFVHVRDEGFRAPEVQDPKELIAVGAVTTVLLIFSIVGSAYVFRGRWITKCRKTGEKENKEDEQTKNRSAKKDNVSVVPDPSSSFYASLEPRTRSIYDELHPSAANNGSHQQRAKPTKKEPHQTKQRSKQGEGQFESVYENY